MIYTDGKSLSKKVWAIGLLIALAPLWAVAADSESPAEEDNNPIVILETTMGDIEVRIFEDKAPISAKNFLAYVKNDYYNGTIFHRVMSDFMIQGGGFTADMVQKKTQPSIKNEAANGLLNKKGTLAMARTGAVDSATSQFFINLKHNTFLDHEVRDYGYAVFGEVVKGMDVVDKIAATPTGTKAGVPNVPRTTVEIISAKLKSEEGEADAAEEKKAEAEK